MGEAAVTVRAMGVEVLTAAWDGYHEEGLGQDPQYETTATGGPVETQQSQWLLLYHLYGHEGRLLLVTLDAHCPP